MHRQFKFLCPLLLTATGFALNTTVETNSGTIVVIGVSKNKIVIAADSRRHEGTGKYADDQCKIITRDDKFVFASNGLAGFSRNVPIPFRPIEMDTNKEAQIAFDSVPSGSDDFLPTVARSWGSQIASFFEQAIKALGPKVVFANIPEDRSLMVTSLDCLQGAVLLCTLKASSVWATKLFSASQRRSL